MIGIKPGDVRDLARHVAWCNAYGPHVGRVALSAYASITRMDDVPVEVLRVLVSAVLARSRERRVDWRAVVTAERLAELLGPHVN